MWSLFCKLFKQWKLFEKRNVCNYWLWWHGVHVTRVCSLWSLSSRHVAGSVIHRECYFVADRDDHIVQAGVSSIISMTIGLLALVACIVLVVVLIRLVSYLTKFGSSFSHWLMHTYVTAVPNLPVLFRSRMIDCISYEFSSSVHCIPGLWFPTVVCCVTVAVSEVILPFFILR